jgi:hypothetical protein
MNSIIEYNKSRVECWRNIQKIRNEGIQNNKEAFLLNINTLYKPLSPLILNHLLTHPSFSLFFEDLQKNNFQLWVDLHPFIADYLNPENTLHTSLTNDSLISIQNDLTAILDPYFKSTVMKLISSKKGSFNQDETKIVFKEILSAVKKGIKPDTVIQPFTFITSQSFWVNILTKRIGIPDTTIELTSLYAKMIHEGVHLIRGLMIEQNNLIYKTYSYSFFEEGLCILAEKVYRKKVNMRNLRHINKQVMYMIFDHLMVPKNTINKIMQIYYKSEIAAHTLEKIQRRNLSHQFGIPELSHQYNNRDLSYLLGLDVILFLMSEKHTTTNAILANSLKMIINTLLRHRLNPLEISSISYLMDKKVLEFSKSEINAYSTFLLSKKARYYCNLINF